MILEDNFIFSPEQLHNKSVVIATIARQCKISADEVSAFRIIRKSIDARKGVKFNVRLQIATNGDDFPDLKGNFSFHDVSTASEFHIIGAGPAGYFAAIQCLLSGLKPIIFERGKQVDERKYDIARLNNLQILNPESNYAFGEGGAGTYSDGKLFTRSKKRGNVTQVLQLLHYFGADEEILVDAHPHIGTDRLHTIMRNIRKTILQAGGEIYFNSRLTSINVKNGKVESFVINGSDKHFCNYLILATGHSARDVFYLLHNSGVKLSAKGFAMGVRVEHPQELINTIQYKGQKSPYLPAATYSFVKQIAGRGVYSFCMCPGGSIVSAVSEVESIVVNGMSNSKRNSPYSNSAVVVELRVEDFANYGDEIFCGLEYQRQLEQLAYRNGGGGITAPAQRLGDFVNSKMSASIPKTTYLPGVVSSPLHFWLPEFIAKRLQECFRQLGQQMRGYTTNDALIIGVESRTSSPVQVLRDSEKMNSVSVVNLFPCGEGAGYAGGIVSSAIDGMEVVKRIIAIYK